jgi:hypothetical protein
LSALYGAKLLIVDLAKGWVMVLCSVATFGFLVIGLLLAIRVIYPRGESLARKLSSGSYGSLTIPSKIAHTYSKAEDYLNEIDAADESRLMNELCTLIYARSYINDVKYFYLKWSILISGAGWGGGLVLLFVAGV